MYRWCQTHEWACRPSCASPDFDAARAGSANVLGTDFIDPNAYAYSDSSDSERDIPSFTILDPPAVAVSEDMIVL